MTQHKEFESIGAMWYDRPATLKACTEQLLEFLLKLKAYKPEWFGIWYEGGRSRKQALEHQVKFTYPGIKRLFSKRIKNDELYPETTYKAGAWSGEVLGSKEACSFDTSIGGSKESTTGANAVYINLGNAASLRQYYQDPAHLEEIIQLLREYWNPAFIRCVPYKGTIGDFIDIY